MTALEGRLLRSQAYLPNLESKRAVGSESPLPHSISITVRPRAAQGLSQATPVDSVEGTQGQEI